MENPDIQIDWQGDFLSASVNSDVVIEIYERSDRWVIGRMVGLSNLNDLQAARIQLAVQLRAIDMALLAATKIEAGIEVKVEP